MKDIQFFYESSLISEKELDDIGSQLIEEITRMNAAQKKDYQEDHASINLLDDNESLKKIKFLINEKKKMNLKYLVVVGIGGSNLGTVAVQEALLGRMYNQLEPPTKILYADTVDTDSLHTIIDLIEPVLKNDGNVLINGVSKSGGTTETIANFEVLIEVLKKYKQDYQNYVVITTDKSSKYWTLAKKDGFALLEIPSKVGGRYSLFSAVGLFPLGILGIDIDELLNGARVMKKRCLDYRIQNNPAAMSASLIYAHHTHGKNIHDLFLFNPDLESVGKWYRQIMGESIGKEYNLKGEQVFTGITPTVSIGSTDLHSMAQLYLGGPFDKFTTFVRVERNNSSICVPVLPDYTALVNGVQGKTLHDIMQAILEGVQASFRKGNRPFVEVVLPDKTAFSIGQFMQFKMMEMMFLGALCGVNPFDQPNVEAYKRETQKILEERSKPMNI
jgi:glucose-6-phosphate isomerase